MIVGWSWSRRKAAVLRAVARNTAGRDHLLPVVDRLQRAFCVGRICMSPTAA